MVSLANLFTVFFFIIFFIYYLLYILAFFGDHREKRPCQHFRRREDAAATNPADKEMIDALVESYPGKHQAK